MCRGRGTHSGNRGMDIPKIFKKVQILRFFKKGELWGQKMKILKKYLQNQKGLQILDTKHVPHAPKEHFQKKAKF